MQAANVVIQMVKAVEGDIIDLAGDPSPEVDVTGSGKAYICVTARSSPGRGAGQVGDITTFRTKQGRPSR